MSNLEIVASQVGILFALMGVGAVCRLCRLVDEAAVKGIVNILILIVTPCLIVDVFQRPFSFAMMQGFGWAFLIVILIHVALILAARFFRDPDISVRPVLRLAIVFSNAGFMGIPLEQAILGAKGVFYGAAYIVIFNILIWSWGLIEMRGSGKANDSVDGFTKKEILRQILLNPGTIGVAIGLPLFLFSIELPPVVRSPISLLAQLNTPLAMLIIGFYLAGANFRRILLMPCVYIAAAFRLMVFPIALIGVLFIFQKYLAREMMLSVVIAASAPVAAMVGMFAAKFNRDIELAVGLVSGTTLLSVLTMPPVIALAMELF